MKRAWASAIPVLAAVAIGIWVVGSLDSGPPFRTAIAYVTASAKGRADVWLAGSDGHGARRLGSGAAPLIAPDGSTVAASASSSTGPALILYSSSGSSPRKYFDGAFATAVAQAWSPDSRFLAVALSSTNPGSDAASGLAVIDTRSGAWRIVARGVIQGASFAPGKSDRIAYASSATTAISAPVDIHVIAADGSGELQLTHDGRSLNPVWGGNVIAFDHEILHSIAEPAYQVWLMSVDGTHPRQLTHEAVPPLVDGLVPIAFSDHDTRLLAAFVGQNTNQAWVITLPTGFARRLEVAGHSVTSRSISHDGRAALVDQGGFLNPPGAGIVETFSLAGGAPRVLIAHGSQPSWNL